MSRPHFPTPKTSSWSRSPLAAMEGADGP
jgi:hypothetical protein